MEKNTAKTLRFLSILIVLVYGLVGCGAPYKTIQVESVSTAEKTNNGVSKSKLIQVDSLLEAGEYNAAVDLLMEALDRTGNDSRTRSDIYYKIGNVFERMNQLPRAIISYRMSLNLNPGQAESSAALLRLTEISSVSR